MKGSIILLLCIGVKLTSAQSIAGESFDFNLNAGIGFGKGTEERFSKNVHQGNPIVFGITVSRIDKKSIQIASVGYSYGNFNFSLNKSVDIRRNSAEVNVSHAWRIGKRNDNGFTGYVGLNTGMIRTTRSYTELLNNNQSYETLIPVDLLLIVSYAFDSKKPVVFQNQTNFAAAGLYKQSAFGNVGTSESATEKWEAASVNRLSRFSNQSYVIWNITQRHFLGLNYSFGYYALATERTVQYLQHSVCISYKLKL